MIVISDRSVPEAPLADIEAVAVDRYADILITGETIAWKDMRAYLKLRLAGQSVIQPLKRAFKEFHGN